MNQSTVPHEEIGVRLSICNEFLSNEKKPIHEAYASLMNKIGRKIMEYSEFEYWFKRFQNNQFDLGYDKSQDTISRTQNAISQEVSRAENDSEVMIKQMNQEEAVEKQMRDLKLAHQFNEKNVPKVFQDLMKDKMDKVTDIAWHVYDRYCTLSLDEMTLTWGKKGDGWLFAYNNINKTIKTDDPEKSIIDHLWFVLKNPDIKLSSFRIQAFPQFKFLDQNEHVPDIDFEKLSTLLHSMLDSIKHQFHTNGFSCDTINISMLSSMLKHLKPGTLERIEFTIMSKNEKNYQEMKEIVEMDQWKQAKRITTSEVIPPLKIEDLLHCEVFAMKFAEITPEDVIRVRELFINSTNSRVWMLFFGNNQLDIDAVRKVLLPNSLSEKGDRISFMSGIDYTYKIPNSPNHFSVTLNGFSIEFNKFPN